VYSYQLLLNLKVMENWKTNSWTVGQLDSWTVGSVKSAVSGQWSAFRNLKFEIWNLFGIWNLEFGIPDPEAYGFHISRARDWPNFTCSVNPHVTQNRHKHRLKTPVEPAESSGMQRLCPVAIEKET
jgi:hypothetical protein